MNLVVKGMTCASCEVLIERSLKKVPGVEKVIVNRPQESVEIDCADHVEIPSLQAAVKEQGYLLSLPEENAAPARSSFVRATKGRFLEIGAVVLLLMGVYLLLKELNILPQTLGVTDNMSYGFVFVLGLVAATSTCLAVAGGLLLAIAGKYNEKYPHLTGWQKFRPHIAFNTGRIISYTLLGGLVGLLGSTLAITPTITGVITIGASVMMIVMGLQFLHIFPWLDRLQIKMPAFITRRVYKESSGTPSHTSSFFFGAGTFFLPCGFTQALQLYVLGKGDFMIGALTMLAFSLGTLPSLAGIGAFSSFAKGKTQRHFMTFSAVLVIMLGVFNMSPGFTLTGASVNILGSSSVSAVDSNQVGNTQIISMAVQGLDYYPNTFTLKKGVPVEWNIDGTKAQGCAQIISVPQLQIVDRLPRDSIKTIKFTPQQAGRITFSCGMGMAGPGTFEVV